MSVDRTTYLLYGFKFTKEKDLDVIDDNWEDLMESGPTNDLFNDPDSKQILVYDGMCGNYAYIGLKLAEIDEYCDDECCVEIPKDDLEGLENQLYLGMDSWPPYLQDSCKDKTPGLYLFVHFW